MLANCRSIAGSCVGRRTRLFLLLATGAAAVSTSVPACAADAKILLRLADSVPATHPISVNGTKFWMDEVKRVTNGQVDFQWYPAEQLGKAKNLLALTQAGTADIGRIGASYTPEKLPLTAVEELPGMISSSCEGSQALWNLTKASGNGILEQKEYAPLHLKVVFAFSNAPYEVQTTKVRQVKTPADMKGLKLKTLGGASDDTANRVGAIPVQMAVADLFLSLQRGTVDGRFGAFGSVKANSTEDVLKYSTSGVQIGSFAVIGVVSDKVWDKLPQNVRDAMLKAGDDTWKNFCTKEDASSSQIRKELEDKYGWQVHDLTLPEQKEWRTALAPVQQKWATDLDKSGKPGTAVLDAFHREIERIRASK
jgi:TRAP-type C4-dicarboxylate transport system substrate-binding protein